MANFKGADAIGNPAGMFASMLASGGMFTMPKSIAFPTVSELAKFPSKELPNIGRQWTQVPASIAETVASDAKGLLSSESLLASLGTILKTIEGVKQVMEIAETVQQIQAGIAGLQQLSEILSGSTGGALFCPGGASYFNLHFQSENRCAFLARHRARGNDLPAGLGARIRRDRVWLHADLGQRLPTHRRNHPVAPREGLSRAG